MTAAPNGPAPLGDWADRGLPAIRAILAEGVTADHADAQRPGQTTWLGNQNAGFDVQSPIGRLDAKSVRIENGAVVLARRNAQPYDTGKVDQITLVHLEARSGVTVDLANRTATLTATATIRDYWAVPVAALNAMMQPHTDGDPAWRNVHLPLNDLEPYRVI